MANFECKCGAILSNSTVPNDTEFYVLSDDEYDDLTVGDLFSDDEEPPLPEKTLWKCNMCNRVHLFQNGNLVGSYIKES